jgi:hypothetical protein
MKQMEVIGSDDMVKQWCKKMAPPLVTLLSTEPEVQYVALRNINLIVQKRPQILAHEVKVRAAPRACASASASAAGSEPARARWPACASGRARGAALPSCNLQPGPGPAARLAARRPPPARHRPPPPPAPAQVFFCKYNDPIYVKMEKLEIMIKLASEKNIDQVLLELKEYAQEVDVDFVRKVRRGLGLGLGCEVGAGGRGWGAGLEAGAGGGGWG